MKTILPSKLIYLLLPILFSLSGCMSSTHTRKEKVNNEDEIVLSYYYIERPEQLMIPGFHENHISFFDTIRWEYWGEMNDYYSGRLHQHGKASIYFDKKSLMTSNNGHVLRGWVCFDYEAGGIKMSLVVINMYAQTFEYLYSITDEGRYDPNFYEKAPISADPENNILNTDPKEKFAPESTEELIFKKLIHYYFEHK